MNFFSHIKKHKTALLVLLLICGFLIRIPLSTVLTESGDFGFWTNWASVLSQSGVSQIYEKTWCDRSPTMLYLLWGIGKIHQHFPHIPQTILFKLPSNLSDFLIALFIFFLARKKGKKAEKAFLFSSLYFFNPITFLNSTFWGQMEAVFTLLIVISLYLLAKNRIYYSVIVLVISVFFKPYSIILVPLFFVVILRRYYRDKISLFKKIFISSIIGFMSTYALHVPFVLKSFSNKSIWNILVAPIIFSWQRLQFAVDAYAFTSVNAFNFWGTFGFFQSDKKMLLGISLKAYGSLIFLAALAIILYFIWRSQEQDYYIIFLAGAVAFLSLFCFITRAHERHLYPFFALLVVALLYQKKFLVSYVILSFIYCVNLILSFVWIISKGSFEIPTSIRVSFSLTLVIITLGHLLAMLKNILRKKAALQSSYLQ